MGEWCSGNTTVSKTVNSGRSNNSNSIMSAASANAPSKYNKIELIKKGKDPVELNAGTVAVDYYESLYSPIVVVAELKSSNRLLRSFVKPTLKQLSPCSSSLLTI